MKMNRDLKILLVSFGLGAFVMVVVHLGAQIFGEVDSNRLTSVGVPQVVDLDPNDGEKSVIFNDASMQKNWGLMGTHGTSDISANKAWQITQGDRRIIVAIIDTGADVNHPDLAENIWKNPGETGLDANGKDKSTNGKDNDGNGYINDVNGWNFVDDNNKVVDNHGHGTHISGIVGAAGLKGGISGVCPKVSLMILKYFDPKSKGNDNLRNTVRAIRYAVDMGANIINYSGGGIDPNDDEFAAVKYAKDHGVLFVAAAGNEHSNSDVSHYYPADYNLSNIISVTAIDPVAKVLRSSNFGKSSVNIAAPGEGIYSTLPSGNYGYMTGTSQATAFVSGVAALILSHNKDFSADQVKKQIVSTADEIPGLRDKSSSGGKLNSYAALAKQPNIPATGITTTRSTVATGLINGATDKRTENSILFGSEPTGGNDDNHVMLSTLIKAINRPLAGAPVSPEKPIDTAKHL
jgi:thermitase